MDPTLPAPPSDASAAPSTLSRRIIAGKYRLDALLGRGASGEVYRAAQIDLARDVAVKLVVAEGGDARARFLREARTAAGIRHPGVVEIFDAGVDESGAPYCAMELLEGETLAARLARGGPLPMAEAVAMAASLSSALQAVHDKGFLHRDVKPGNVFLARRPDGGTDAKLIDFGIAKRVEVEPAAVRRATLRGLGWNDGPIPTAANVIVGTPLYLSPEQIMGATLDARSDVYALATTLYEALSGAPPFVTEDTVDLLARILVEVPAPLGGVPGPLDREIRRALAKDPAQRHANASDFAAALWGALAEDRISGGAAPGLPTRRGAPLLVAAVAVAVVAALGVVWLRRPAPSPPPEHPPVVVAATAAPPPPLDVPALAPEAPSAAPNEGARQEPRAKTARPPAGRASATASAPSAPSAAPTTNMKLDDLKAPY